MIEFWAFAVLFAAGLAALARHSGIGAYVAARLPRRQPSRFEGLWSRLDGRVLALAWIAIFAAAWLAPFAVGISLWGSVGEHPIRDAVLLGVQSVASLLLVPLTAGLYVYKRAIPQIARDEADEREQLVQGGIYRRTHLLIMAGSAVVGTLVAVMPDGVRYMWNVAYFHGVGLVDLLLPAWVLVFMLPSVIYSWMYPSRDDDDLDVGALAG